MINIARWVFIRSHEDLSESVCISRGEVTQSTTTVRETGRHTAQKAAPLLRVQNQGMPGWAVDEVYNPLGSCRLMDERPISNHCDEEVYCSEGTLYVPPGRKSFR